MNSVQIPDTRVIDKYEPRKSSWYTLYPIHAQWDEGHDLARSRIDTALDEYVADGNRSDLELYIHFPFCHSQCFFCQCATVISRSYEHYTAFLDHLEKEVSFYTAAFAARGFTPRFTEIHFGGGSPSLLNEEDFARLIRILAPLADIRQVSEAALEIDPRFNVAPDKLAFYSEAGVTRISFGVQDFDPQVQKAVNRINPPEMMAPFLTPERRRLFSGVNFDILFGLPLQTEASHRSTIETLLALDPDRVNICLLGHRPDVFPHQRAYRTEDIPDRHSLMRMKVDSLNRMVEAGYERIGIDHFAKPGDSFSEASRRRTLVRNINGYGTGKSTNTLGLGLSAVTTLGRFYFQNYYTLVDYQTAVDAGVFPLIRSRPGTADDMLRRRVIFDLILFSEVRKDDVAQAFGIDFDDYFAPDLARLKELEDDGLVTLAPDRVTLTEAGRLMPRHVCAEFDFYVNNTGFSYAHSREVGNGLQSLRRVNHFATAGR